MEHTNTITDTSSQLIDAVIKSPTKKNKKEIKKEKNLRLQEYLDTKRLQQELDYIEGWVKL